MNQAIGVILGNREASPLEFWVGVREGFLLGLDDLVYAESTHNGLRVRYYGVVDRVGKILEGAQLDSDTFLAAERLIPTNVAYVAHVTVTRLSPEDYLPPNPADSVFKAYGQALAEALYYDGMVETDSEGEERSMRLPVGLLRNKEPAYVNLAFLDGRRGGHVNISGISGVAAKTSYALFLLYSLYNSGVLKDAGSTRTVVFNVKGEDLFYLDKENRSFHRHKEAAADFRKLGLEPHAFSSVAFCAPPGPGEGDLVPSTQRKVGVMPYHWDLVQFAREGLLPFLFTDRGAMSNLGFLIDQVTEQLRRVAKGQKGPALLVDDWSSEALEHLDGADFEALGKTRIASFERLVEYLEFKLLGTWGGEPEDTGDIRWTARQHAGTLQAFVRRLKAATRNVGLLLRGDRPGRPPDPLTGGTRLSVIDINQLSAQAQMFVVGSILQRVFASKERGDYRGKVFVVLDELNKYAPREGDSPIKDILLDIAERGRSLGVILIGAQQTASEVERRVVANAAVRVVGRLDAAEAERPEYRFMSGAFRERALILPQGAMILHQPEVPTPLALSFPFPPWATKASEVLEDNSSVALREEFDL